MERNSIERERQREREGQKESKIRKKEKKKGEIMESLSMFSCLLSLLIWENPWGVLYFTLLTVLESSGQLFCRMFNHLDVPR